MEVGLPDPRARTVTTAGGRALPGLLRSYPLAVVAALGIVAALLLLPLHREAAEGVFAAVAVGCGAPVVWGTLRSIFHGRFHVDLIATLAIVGAVLFQEYAAGALVVLMQTGGEALEDYGLRRANRSLDNLLKRAPGIAHRKRGSEVIDVLPAELEVGDLLLIRPGDILPADGIVAEGQGSVDEAALTGEPVPLAKLPGDRVFSGTINLSGSLVVRTTSPAAESKYELIVRMVKQAEGEKAPINRLANAYTPPFTVLTLVIMGLVIVLTGNWHRALAVLVVATPCPLIIATPLAVLSAINRAAALNIIVKSGAAIEQSGAVDTVVFDKTGTLTVGQPSLDEVRLQPFDLPSTTVTGDQVVQWAAAVELLSAHVLATAVVKEARRRRLEIPPASHVRETPGTGVSGRVLERRVSVGSAAYLHAEGVLVPEALESSRRQLGADGNSVSYVAVDGVVAAMLVFRDRIRPEARRLLERLDELGIRRTVMLTGDAPESARAVGAQVGIADVRPRLQPEAKLAAVRALAEGGTVMMVGDGINDAPALAAARVGVAMGGYGAGIAADAADVVITVENVERVADTIAVGRRMVGVARQGILLGIGTSVVLMVLASLGYIPPAVGAVLQELLDLATILNALRAR